MPTTTPTPIIIVVTFLAARVDIARLIAANIAADNDPAVVNLGVATDAFGSVILTGAEADIIAAVAPYVTTEGGTKNGLRKTPVACDAGNATRYRIGLALVRNGKAVA